MCKKTVSFFFLRKLTTVFGIVLKKKSLTFIFGKQIELRAILQDSDGGQGSEEGGW